MKLAQIFQNGMVLQYGKPVKLWGENTVRREVQVLLNGNCLWEGALPEGTFSVTLPAQSIMHDAVLTILQGDKILLKLTGVCFGEVWLCGGQSNMEFPLKLDEGYPELMKTRYRNDDLRFYEVPKRYFDRQPEDERLRQAGKWYGCTPDTLEKWNGVGFYFAAKRAAQHPGLPIGIVSCNYGGSYIACWISEERLRADAQLKFLCDKMDAFSAEADHKAYEKRVFKQLKQNENPIALKLANIYLTGKIPKWVVKLAWKSRNGQPGQTENYGYWDHWRPGGLYEFMLSKVIPFTISGFLWYQGEAETERMEYYIHSMALLIGLWREQWGEELPFYMVELAPFDHDIFQEGSKYPQIRRMQRQLAEELPRVYTINIDDAGEPFNIHPPHKRPVGERLADKVQETLK